MTSMSLQMLIIIAFLSKALGAQLACELLNIQMHLHM